MAGTAHHSSSAPALQLLADELHRSRGTHLPLADGRPKALGRRQRALLLELRQPRLAVQLPGCQAAAAYPRPLCLNLS
eukprot:COSAG01_NODE_7718_length_3085_cov_2.157066_4_plen_78_part_00